MPDKFHTKQEGGYTTFGLRLTDEKTAIFAKQLMRNEMLQNIDTVTASVKTLKTTLLYLGYDAEWVCNDLLPQFQDNLLNALNE